MFTSVEGDTTPGRTIAFFTVILALIATICLAALLATGMRRKLPDPRVTDPIATVHLSGGYPTMGWSPDGNLLATGGPGTVVQVLTTPSFEQVHELSVDGTSIRGIAWSPDGAKLAITSWDAAVGQSTVYIWDTFFLHTLAANRDTIFSNLAWSPDGDLLGGSDGSEVHIWNTNNDELLGKFTGSIEEWSPDGTKIAQTLDYNIQVLDIKTSQVQLTLETPYFWPERPIDWSPDGTMLTGSQDGNGIVVWDAHTGQTLHLLSHEEGVDYNHTTSIVWSPDGTKIANLEQGGNLEIWDTNSEEVVYIYRVRSNLSPGEFAWNPGGTRIAAFLRSNTASVPGQVWVWDLGTSQPIVAQEFQNVSGLDWHPGGHLLAIATASEVQIWDMNASSFES